MLGPIEGQAVWLSVLGGTSAEPSQMLHTSAAESMKTDHTELFVFVLNYRTGLCIYKTVKMLKNVNFTEI